MSCYVCAHLLSAKPKSASPLPGGSPVAVDDPLGTCTGCGILACSLHAARYAPYQCALCLPATAIVSAVSGTPSAAAGAAVTAVPRGTPLPDDVTRALRRIVADLADAGRPGGLRQPRARAEPNVVDDLEGAIEEFGGIAARDLTGADAARRPAIVAAAVRARMSGLVPAPPPQSVAMLAGALAIAYELATGIRMFDEHRTVTDLPMPWSIDSPVLLDPLIWMVVVAARLG